VGGGGALLKTLELCRKQHSRSSAAACILQVDGMQVPVAPCFAHALILEVAE